MLNGAVEEYSFEPGQLAAIRYWPLARPVNVQAADAPLLAAGVQAMSPELPTPVARCHAPLVEKPAEPLSMIRVVTGVVGVLGGAVGGGEAEGGDETGGVVGVEVVVFPAIVPLR